MLNKPFLLVTGCAGFLGSHLLESLASQDVQVLGIDNTLKQGYVRDNITVKKIDLMSKKGVLEVKKDLDRLKSRNIRLVHLMAISNTEDCEKNRELAYEVNVKSIKSIWELIRHYDIKKVVFPSTALVYGFQYEENVNEEFLPFPENAYARAKLEAENFLVSNSVNSAVTTVILRLSNTYGFGMNMNTVIGTILRQLGEGHLKLKEYKTVRDYVYVDDVIKAFVLAIFSACSFKVYNVGSSIGYSVWELVNQIAKATHRQKLIEGIKLSSEDREHGQKLVLDCKRIRDDLKWVSTYDVQAGIKDMTHG